MAKNAQKAARRTAAQQLAEMPLQQQSAGVSAVQLEVASVTPSRRRAGITFTNLEITVLETADFTEEDIEAIKSDRMLRVREVFPKEATDPVVVPPVLTPEQQAKADAAAAATGAVLTPEEQAKADAAAAQAGGAAPSTQTPQQ